MIATGATARMRYSTFRESILMLSIELAGMPSSSSSPLVAHAKKSTSPAREVVPFGLSPGESIVSSSDADQWPG